MIILDRWAFGEFEVDISPHILGLPTDFDAARKIVSFADFGGENGCRPWPRHRHYVGGHLFWLRCDTGRWPVPLALIYWRRRRDCRRSEGRRVGAGLGCTWSADHLQI